MTHYRRTHAACLVLAMLLLSGCIPFVNSFEYFIFAGALFDKTTGDRFIIVKHEAHESLLLFPWTWEKPAFDHTRLKFTVHRWNPSTGEQVLVGTDLACRDVCELSFAQSAGNLEFGTTWVNPSITSCCPAHDSPLVRLPRMASRYPTIRDRPMPVSPDDPGRVVGCFDAASLCWGSSIWSRTGDGLTRVLRLNDATGEVAWD